MCSEPYDVEGWAPGEKKGMNLRGSGGWRRGRQEVVPWGAAPTSLMSSTLLSSCFLPLGLHKLSEESTLGGTGAWARV